jgi:hypothetical protein
MNDTIPMYMIEIFIPIIISLIALYFSGTSLYYSHLQGPKFRIEHLSFEKVEHERYEQFRHTIAIVNNGNKTGLLRDVIAKRDKENAAEIKSSLLKISHGSNFIETIAVIPIKPKEAIVIIYDYTITFIGAPHQIDITYDDATIFGIRKKTIPIWKREKGK